jgi:hypothetical protein
VIVFDATMLLLLMRPDVNAPIDANTGTPVTRVEARIKGLIEKLEKEKTKIIVPTPALSELFVRAGESIPTLINEIQKSPVFRIEPFDTLAAIEVALMTRQAIDCGDKRSGVDCTWAKVKYDRQIIGIAKVHRASAIYSDDDDVHILGGAANIRVLKLADLPIPTEELQAKIDFPENKIDDEEKN